MSSIRFEPPVLSQTKHAALLRECMEGTSLPWPTAELVVCQLWENDPVHLWLRVRGKRPLSVSLPPSLLQEPHHAASVKASFDRLLSQCKTAWSVVYSRPAGTSRKETSSARKAAPQRLAVAHHSAQV